MHERFFVAALFLFLALIHLSQAQSCELYNIQNNAFCLARTRYKTFLNANQTQNSIGLDLYAVLNTSQSDLGEWIFLECVSIFLYLINVDSDHIILPIVY